MKLHFNKTCYAPEQHISILKTRGLVIESHQLLDEY